MPQAALVIMHTGRDENGGGIMAARGLSSSSISISMVADSRPMVGFHGAGRAKGSGWNPKM